MPAGPYRDAALLDGLGQRADLAEGVVLAPEVHGLARPHLPHEADELVGDSPALLVGGSVQRVELFLHPPHARAQDDASAREDVHGGQHLGGDHRIAVRDDEDAGADVDALGQRSQMGHERQRLEISLFPVAGDPAVRRVRIGRLDLHRDHDMIGDEDRIVAEGVSLLRELEENLGLGERSAALKGEAEFHGRHIARHLRNCQAHQGEVRLTKSSRSAVG
jgi:hypothetical protein